MSAFTSEDAQKLLHNKFVVVLGDSIQRSVYKDLVKMLQHDSYLTQAQLKRKGEMTFEMDTLVEGGMLNEMHNGVDYREVRQYRTGHHLVRFYFLTRAYSTYLESILADFEAGPQPDVLIINSCFWDLTRYNSAQMEDYKSNLQKLFVRLSETLNLECLILWSMAMPVGYKDGDIPKIMKHNLRWDVVEGNFYSATLANLYNIDVLDMHHYFRLDLQRRCRDAIHWDQLAHRKYTQLLLAHIAQEWGVEAPQKKYIPGCREKTIPAREVRWRGSDACHYVQPRMKEVQPPWILPPPRYMDFNTNFNRLVNDACFMSDSPLLVGELMPGYHSFDGNCFNRQGPPGNHLPFRGMDMTMNPVPEPYFPVVPYRSFPPPGPFPPNGFRGPQRIVTNHHFRPRQGWAHPYHRPPPPPARIC